jgi:hypothetical protein
MPIEPIKPISSTLQLDLDMGKEDTRQREQPKTKDAGKAAIVNISDEAIEKARSRAAENEEFKDKRTPKSDLIRQAEIERMKEILNKPKVGGGGGGGMGTGKMNRDISKNYKSGGKVKSASARADGCAIRGKTRA